MKIAVSGAAGRMGKRILALANDHPDIDISGALESPGHPLLGKDAGEVAGIGMLGVPITEQIAPALDGCDVLVEFSAPQASLDHVRAAAEAGKAIVVGTTGFSEEQKQEMLRAGATTRFLIAPNMSMGVNVLFSLVESAAQTLGVDYEVEIIEAHHNKKKDAPSGTANKLAEIVAEARSLDIASARVCGREGMVGQRKPNEIGVMAVRGGDIVGEHTVTFITNGERLELIHRAHSRDALAKGAVQAALWLVSQPNGVYDMQDVLGLKADS